MAVLTPEQQALLRTDLWFSSLPADMAQWFIDKGRVRKLPHGQHLAFRGAGPDGLYGLLSGGIRMYASGPDGREALVAFLEPPTWFGEVAFFDGLPRSHDMQAEGETCVLHVMQGDLRALVTQSPQHWHHLGVLMALKLRLLLNVLESQSLLPLSGQLAKRLLWMLRTSPQVTKGCPLQLRLKQALLAQAMGVSRQTVNRLLMGLQEQGVLKIRYGVLEVVDVQALADAAQLTHAERRTIALLDARSGVQTLGEATDALKR
jgi:CRP/FNR family transcriptional regulator, cyclic AMP receptor protein